MEKPLIFANPTERVTENPGAAEPQPNEIERILTTNER